MAKINRRRAGARPKNNAEFAQPNVLVKLALEHDRMFTY